MTKKTQSPKELKKFGITLAGLFLLFFALSPYIKGHRVKIWPWPVAIALLGLALFKPVLLRPLQRFWGVIGEVLGAINIRIVLGLFYFIFFVPFGVLRKLFGKDPMKRKYEPKELSYKIKRTEVIVKDQMEKIY